MHSVLIVEDERVVAKDLQQTLAAMGYDAFAIASSADEALLHVAKRCPDLILMDIRIKGARDGIETTTLLRERFDIPVVYLTAHADDATIARAKATAPYGYLLKPVKPAELRSAIEVTLYRHEMERRLRERERWFSTTLRSIADAVITVDLAGNVTFMNPVAEQLTGVAAADAVGRPAREIVQLCDPDAATRLDSPLEAALREVKPSLLAEAALIARDQTRRLIGDSTAPVTDAGQLLGAVMVFRDITEQKLARRQLELADRLASLGTMAAGVAHEVNNPLAVVLANAQFVQQELVASGQIEATRAAAEIEGAATRIARIVGDLKAFSRPPEQASGGADVARAVEWAVRATAHELRHRARVAIDVPALPAVHIDESRLGQVLVNLLVNAAHAIAPGKVQANEVAIRASLVDQRIAIEIRDTGPGMPPEVIERAFEPFYTTKRVGEGTGLGLSICHGIITSAGGKITIDSAPGRGTTFRIALPIAAHEREQAAVAPARPVARRRGRILIVDDEPMVHRAIKRILRDHDLVSTENGREALDLIERGEQFDLVLSDLMMPNMTGIELYEQLLERDPALARRVVFVTGGAVTAHVADFLKTVPNTVIEKPFGMAEMRPVVDRLLDGLQ